MIIDASDREEATKLIIEYLKADATEQHAQSYAMTYGEELHPGCLHEAALKTAHALGCLRRKIGESAHNRTNILLDAVLRYGQAQQALITQHRLADRYLAVVKSIAQFEKSDAQTVMARCGIDHLKVNAECENHQD